jgi:hypothetical protein
MIVLIIHSCFLITIPGYGQAENTILPTVIQRAPGPVIFDGYINEPSWGIADSFPMIGFSPVYGNPVLEQSDIRMTYDESYVYIGAMLYDRNPSEIRPVSRKRDEMGGSSDWLAIILDTYNDNENAVAFMTTPEGLRTDVAVFNDASGGYDEEPFNTSWNTFWDVLAHITETGWSAEIRIPVSSLRFQESDGEVTMGLIIWRWIPHLNELQVFPAIPPEYGPYSFWKPSQAHQIVFQRLQGENPLYVTPYISGGYEQLNELNDEETEYIYSAKPKLEAGIDLKYGLTSNLTLDLTVNTDFAQVEADDQVINMTRFSYYFPEKRQFFLERSSIFEFNLGGPNDMMFYSRRVGLNEEEIVRLYGGARIIGRQGPWDVGFLDMQTAPSSDTIPSENFGVLRLKRRTFNSNSYLGGVVTSRLGMNGAYNVGYGIDGLIRVTGDEYLKVIAAQTMASDMHSGALSLHPSRIDLSWERRKDVGLFYEVFTGYSGKEFDPGIGFQIREDFTVLGTILGKGWLMNEKSSLFKQSLSLRTTSYLRNSFNNLESVKAGPYHQLEFRSMLTIGWGIWFNYENLFEPFELSDDISVPVGDYKFPSVTGFVMTPVGNPLNIFFLTESGGYFDGKSISVSATPAWSISSNLQLSGYYQYNLASFPERNQEYVAHIARIKLLYMFSTRLSLSAFLQYNSAEDVIISNFRFRYNPREGNDFYIVYNEGDNSNLEKGMPVMPEIPRINFRTILFKYTYTFIL